jgi:hypothetical protein
VFYDIDNLCANREEQDHFKHFQPMTVADSGEIMSNEWASNTQDSIKEDKDFDSDQDFFLALMLYGDKTGTNINQWYPFEPWMFTLVLLWLMAREDLCSLSPDEKLQQYHDYMSVLLKEVKKVAEMKQTMWVNLGGIWKKRTLLIVFSIVSGDQSLQDYLCGRKASNNGSAGHIHCSCMALGVNATTVGPDGILHGGCQKLPTQVLNRLNDLALMDVSNNANSGPMALVQQILLAKSRKQWREKRLVVEHLGRVQRLSKSILSRCSRCMLIAMHLNKPSPQMQPFHF